MSYKCFYAQEPAVVLCMPLPDGSTDIWLTKNAEPMPRDGDEQGGYVADESYLRYHGIVTTEQVQASFDAWWSAANAEQTLPTVEERVATLETAVDNLIVAALEG